MKAWSPGNDDAKFELTPMIDVVFLLISFFMTVTSFASAELVMLKMPFAKNAKVPDNSKDRQYVSIDVNGEYFLGSFKSNLEDIKKVLAARNSVPGFKGVYLRADMNTPHKYVNDLMKACAEVGIYNIIFGTLQE